VEVAAAVTHERRMAAIIARAKDFEAISTTFIALVCFAFGFKVLQNIARLVKKALVL
jgi:hypothetical protein